MKILRKCNDHHCGGEITTLPFHPAGPVSHPRSEQFSWLRFFLNSKTKCRENLGPNHPGYHFHHNHKQSFIRAPMTSDTEAP